MKMIVCVASDFGIGNGGRLLFNLPPDMKLFRETTLGKTVIMGRSTLDTFPGGKPLKNRENIVLTRDKGFSRDGVVALNSVNEVLEYVSRRTPDDVFVIGGAQIYALFSQYCTEAVVTKVRKQVPADSFLFDIDSSADWTLAEESDTMTHDDLQFTFCKYIKAERK